jgi:hypothetical protein
MYAREVLERNNCDAGRTQLGGSVVDLGGFKNFVYGHDYENRRIRMRFEIEGYSLPSYPSEFGYEAEKEEYFLEHGEDLVLFESPSLREISESLGLGCSISHRKGEKCSCSFHGRS